MTEKKQELFVERVMLLHGLAIRRSSVHSQNVRLSAAQWSKEVDTACVGQYILEQMADARDAQSKEVFDEKAIELARTRFLEGPFGLEQFACCSDGFCLSLLPGFVLCC